MHLKLNDAKAQKSNEGEILEKTITKLFQGNNKCIWSEQVRYSLKFKNLPNDSNDVQQLIELLQNKNGLLNWIEKWI